MADDDLKRRRRARHDRRTAPRPASRTRPSDIAPRRITDGIKPNHRSWASAFPGAPAGPAGANTTPKPAHTPRMPNTEREAHYRRQSGGRLTVRQVRQLRRMDHPDAQDGDQ